MRETLSVFPGFNSSLNAGIIERIEELVLYRNWAYAILESGLCPKLENMYDEF